MTTTRGNKIMLNQTFLAADLKIRISGMKVPQDAGYGAAEKAILRGVAGPSSIRYNTRGFCQGENHRAGAPLRITRGCGWHRRSIARPRSKTPVLWWRMLMRKMRRRTTEPWDYYAVREGGTGVVIVQHPLGLSIRG